MTDLNVQFALDNAVIRAWDIVHAYVSNNQMSRDDLQSLIRETHRTVLGIYGADAPPEAEPVVLTPAVPIKKRFTDTHVICLDDGLAFRSMRRHLTALGMTADQYRAKWGLPKDDPIVHPSYSAKRSELAKKSGLGRKD
jgi:predicted transcriptional regulator